MDKQTLQRLKIRAAIFKAMAHPARLLVIERLAESERSVWELTEMVGSDISTVSRHLTVLKNAGIVTDDKRGNQVYYSLRFPCVLDFFSCAESVLLSAAEERLKLSV